jgi:protein SERAC1
MSDCCLVFVDQGSAHPKPDALFDVVFVHGLRGHFQNTWTNDSGDYWLNWLAEDFPSLNIYSASYDSSFFASIGKGGGPSLGERASMLMDVVVSRRTSDRPLIFVCHSLGGLIVKQMLRKSSDSSNVRRKRLCQQANSTIFIATPHQGAKLANSMSAVLGLFTSKTVSELSSGIEPLSDLGSWFSNWAHRKSLKVESYHEVEKTKGVLVVDHLTSNPNVLGCDPVAVQADHVSITKPETRSAQIYKSISAHLHDAIQTSKSEAVNSGEIDSQFAVYTTHADDDRRSLAEKLHQAGRGHEVRRAERLKEQFSMMLNRNIAQPSAVRRYTRLMSNIESRFHRHVAPAIHSQMNATEINNLLQDKVLDPSLKAQDEDGGDDTLNTVESAYYYLAGNCHIGWGL